MELYIRGPAFGLPSIDAECIATVALLRLYAEEDWELTPTHNDTRRLPCLIDRNQRVSGFTAIARHLSDRYASSVKYSRLSADAIAVTTFLEAHAQILLDVSLYVSFENYRLATRPAFTKILPWYANYITPPKLRSAARARTEHLGISSIDVDDVHEDLSDKPSELNSVGKQQGFEAETQKRASLLLPRKETVRSLLGKPQHAAAFRLHALAENFFQPLQEFLADKHFLLDDDQATQVDCLAYGYLSLMLYPQVPQDWLASSLRRSYPKIVAYVERLDAIFNLRTSVSNVMALSNCETETELRAHRVACHMQLPWQIPPPRPLLETVKWTLAALTEYFSPVGPLARIVPMQDNPRTFWARYGWTLAGVVAALTGFGIHWAFRIGAWDWPRGQEIQIFGRRRVMGFDHLGAALAGISLLNREAKGDAAFHQREEMSHLPVVVEVVSN